MCVEGRNPSKQHTLAGFQAFAELTGWAPEGGLGPMRWKSWDREFLFRAGTSNHWTEQDQAGGGASELLEAPCAPG